MSTTLESVGEDRYLDRVRQGRYTVRNAISRPDALHWGASVLLSIYGLLAFRIASSQTLLFAIAAAVMVHILLGGLRVLVRSNHKPQMGHVHTSWDVRERAGEGVLIPASGKPFKKGRWLSGLFQMTWGMILTGLPALFLDFSKSALSVVLSGAAFVLASALFGRGFRAIVGTQSIESWWVDARGIHGLVAGRPYEMYSWSSLKHMPVLMKRSHDWTLAFDCLPQPSLAPLPVYALVGADTIDEAKARQALSFKPV